MANSIALAAKYLPLLDEVYKRESKTARFDASGARVQFTGANTVNYYKTAMDGLGNYGRNTGFVDGDVTGTWEPLTLTKDRGRSFAVDSMDNEETLGMAFGTLAGEFMRTQVIPELDAYRFAKMAGTTGISAANADITSSTDVADLIDSADQVMSDNEVPKEGRVIFMSESAYKQFKGNITRYLANENGVSREVEMYNGMEVVTVPTGRFQTAITLYDGSTSGQEAGGFIPTTGGYKINFLIVHPSAIVQITKHAPIRIFEPSVNQKMDAWKFDYRIYHDMWVLDNKVKGIYLHRAATAIP